MANPKPWLVYDAIEYLDRLEIAGKHVFEYGSGGSTLYWQRRGAVCISIEHNAAWYALLQKALATGRHVDYRLVLPEALQNAEIPDAAQDPDCYMSRDKGLASCSFRQYVTQIDEFPEAFFDLVLIDGRSRPACIKHSAPKIKPNGRLIIDNSDRDYYFSMTRPFLEHFELEARFSGPVSGCRVISATSFYRKHG